MLLGPSKDAAVECMERWKDQVQHEKKNCCCFLGTHEEGQVAWSCSWSGVPWDLRGNLGGQECFPSKVNASWSLCDPSMGPAGQRLGGRWSAGDPDESSCYKGKRDSQRAMRQASDRLECLRNTAAAAIRKRHLEGLALWLPAAARAACLLRRQKMARPELPDKQSDDADWGSYGRI